MAEFKPLTGLTYNEDGSANYTSLEGDIVGLLCCRHYGHEWGTTETVLGANPGLAAYGVFLPAGVVVLLPVLTQSQESTQSGRKDTINLYDD